MRDGRGEAVERVRRPVRGEVVVAERGEHGAAGGELEQERVVEVAGRARDAPEVGKRRAAVRRARHAEDLVRAGDLGDGPEDRAGGERREARVRAAAAWEDVDGGVADVWDEAGAPDEGVCWACGCKSEGGEDGEDERAHHGGRQ